MHSIIGKYTQEIERKIETSAEENVGVPTRNS
jgi:hypothetical protein